MKIAWTSDPHFDVLDSSTQEAFIQELCSQPADCLCVTGDVANGPNCLSYLERIVKATNKPLYFVLGNHDYYNSSIAQVRAYAADELPDQYLTIQSYKAVNDVAIIGHDCWYDMRLGAINPIRFIINDWSRIQEFQGTCHWLGRQAFLDEDKIIKTARMLADTGADHIHSGIQAALNAGFKKIVVLTHVPPFEYSAQHNGKPSDAYALPVFTNRALGDMLNNAAILNQDAQFVVLCGHTHSGYDSSLLPNLRCVVGSSDYGTPKFAIIEL